MNDDVSENSYQQAAFAAAQELPSGKLRFMMGSAPQQRNVADLEGEANAVQVVVSDTDVVMYFPYDKTAIAQVKAFENAEYHPQDKAWSLPRSPENELELYDLICDLRQHFLRLEKQDEARKDFQGEVVGTVLDFLREDFDHPDLEINQYDRWIAVRFPYDPKAIKAIKKIPGRQWDAHEKFWLLPPDREKQIRSALSIVMRGLS